MSRVNGRPKDPVWKYYENCQEDGKNNRRCVCRFCGTESAAIPTRMVNHLLQKCTQVSSDVKKTLQVVKRRPVVTGSSSKSVLNNGEHTTASALPSVFPVLPTTTTGPAVSSVVSRAKTILAYGDSITWGWNGNNTSGETRLPYDERWTSLLETLLTGMYPGTKVIAEGLSGRTVVFDDPLMNQFCDTNGRNVLLPILHSHKPLDLVILFLGTNELRHRLNLSGMDIATGLNILVQDIKKSQLGTNVDVLIISPPYVIETKCALGWGFKQAAKKSLEVAQACKAFFEHGHFYGIHYLDITKLVHVAKDGVHLDVEGNSILSTLIAARVRDIFALRATMSTPNNM